jgi:hypothetical protein
MIAKFRQVGRLGTCFEGLMTDSAVGSMAIALLIPFEHLTLFQCFSAYSSSAAISSLALVQKAKALPRLMGCGVWLGHKL